MFLLYICAERSFWHNPPTILKQKPSSAYTNRRLCNHCNRHSRTPSPVRLSKIHYIQSTWLFYKLFQNNCNCIWGKGKKRQMVCFWRCPIVTCVSGTHYREIGERPSCHLIFRRGCGCAMWSVGCVERSRRGGRRSAYHVNASWRYMIKLCGKTLG